MTLNPNSKSLWPSELACINEKDKQAITDRHIDEYQRLLTNESISLSDATTTLFRECYVPLAHWIVQQNIPHYTLGINGAQGVGKTTFTKILKLILNNEYDLSVVRLSLDDFYLEKSARLKLATKIHPLLSTRGVPGTHDIDLAMSTFEQLKHYHQPISIPAFDKASDDRSNKSLWKTINEQPDVILFEGWCVGAVPASIESLRHPINRLEETEDANLIWREYVNQQLEKPYQALFGRIDDLVMLKVPSYNKILQWRILQESKLLVTAVRDNNQCMSPQQIERFIMHFERITRHMLEEMPNRATLTLELNDQHQIDNCIVNT